MLVTSIANYETFAIKRFQFVLVSHSSVVFFTESISIVYIVLCQLSDNILIQCDSISEYRYQCQASRLGFWLGLGPRSGVLTQGRAGGTKRKFLWADRLRLKLEKPSRIILIIQRNSMCFQNSTMHIGEKSRPDLGPLLHSASCQKQTKNSPRVELFAHKPLPLAHIIMAAQWRAR